MGFWALEQYEEFVERHASSSERDVLTEKPRERWDENYKNLYVAFEALPKWMSVSNIISLSDRDINFHSLVKIYQLETRQHFESVNFGIANDRGTAAIDNCACFPGMLTPHNGVCWMFFPGVQPLTCSPHLVDEVSIEK